jgi:sulfhydrogenase subunit beta (sulfur reductase)
MAVSEASGLAERDRPAAVIDRGNLDELLKVLLARGFKVIGPTIRDRAIVYDEIASTADLPEGWTDEQEGGTYRLKPREDGALFGFNVGPNSWKSHLFPPRLTLWRARRGDDGEMEFSEEAEEVPRYAFVGVRSCDLAAIGVQDRVFVGDSYTDPDYAARRKEAFIVVVNCGQAANTCFCVSMETGPRAERGFDLALTELLEDGVPPVDRLLGGGHRFLVEVGSERGAEILAEASSRPAEEPDQQAALEVSERCASQMGRELDTDGIKELLYRNMEHPRWDEVSERCLTCGNCTLVCPTCFCSTVEDTTDLAGEEAERTRLLDSCFTLDHSHVHGGSVRNSPRSRYRQWMTHKLATWIDQFGTSGCVGCGRCITWCPVAIDITEEAAAIRATDLGEEGRKIDAGD